MTVSLIPVFGVKFAGHSSEAQRNPRGSHRDIPDIRRESALHFG